MTQALAAIAPEGVISVIGYLSGTGSDVAGASFLDCLERDCTVRGVLVGSKMLFEQVIDAVEANGIKPVIDEREWRIEEAAEAMQWMADGKNFVSTARPRKRPKKKFLSLLLFREFVLCSGRLATWEAFSVGFDFQVEWPMSD